MSPAPTSFMSQSTKPAHSQRTESQDSVDSLRKRVGKACDRCRLKKSKCDGTAPCGRCRTDNAICEFGERKKLQDKAYPKGYVEVLEQQQTQLVSALVEMYRRLLAAQAWNGPPLPEINGKPLTHDLLAALNMLEKKGDGSGDVECFEEDGEKLQNRLLVSGLGQDPRKEYFRRDSFSSDSDHSQHDAIRQGSGSMLPPTPPPPTFRGSFTFNNSAASSPVPQIPVARQRQSYPPAQSSPLKQEPSSPNPPEPMLYEPEYMVPDMSTPGLFGALQETQQNAWMEQNWAPEGLPVNTSQMYDDDRMNSLSGCMNGLQDYGSMGPTGDQDPFNAFTHMEFHNPVDFKTPMVSY